MTINEYVELMKPFSRVIDQHKLGLSKIVICYGQITNAQNHVSTNSMIFDSNGNALGLWSKELGEGEFEKVLYRKPEP